MIVFFTTSVLDSDVDAGSEVDSGADSEVDTVDSTVEELSVVAEELSVAEEELSEDVVDEEVVVDCEEFSFFSEQPVRAVIITATAAIDEIICLFIKFSFNFPLQKQYFHLRKTRS